MTEATGGGGGGRAEVERRIIEKSLADEVFRQRLLEDPKGALEEELGTRLPEGVQVRVVEESADTISSGSPLGGEGGDLSDRDLEAVAGGGFFDDRCFLTEQTAGCQTVGCPPRRAFD